MLPPDLEKEIVTNILNDVKLAHSDRLDLCRYVIFVLSKNFSELLTEVRFCLKTAPGQYMFELVNPKIATALLAGCTDVSIHFCSKGKYYHLIDINDSCNPAVVLECAVRKFLDDFLKADSIFLDDLIASADGAYESALKTLGLNYSWSTLTYTESDARILTGAHDGLPSVHIRYERMVDSIPDLKAFKATVELNSRRVLAFLRNRDKG